MGHSFSRKRLLGEGRMKCWSGCWGGGEKESRKRELGKRERGKYCGRGKLDAFHKSWQVFCPHVILMEGSRRPSIFKRGVERVRNGKIPKWNHSWCSSHTREPLVVGFWMVWSDLCYLPGFQNITIFCIQCHYRHSGPGLHISWAKKQDFVFFMSEK